MRESGGLFSSDDESDPDGSKMPKSKFFSGLFPEDPDFEVTAEEKVRIAQYRLDVKVKKIYRAVRVRYSCCMIQTRI